MALNLELIPKAKIFADNAHNAAGCRYDGQPYSVHTDAVGEIARENKHYLPPHLWAPAICAAYLHDVIEDARVTYNDLRKEFDITTCEIVYALTNEKCRTRAERANWKYYKGIRETPGAVFVKLCDRLANLRYSRIYSGPMLYTYRAEHRDFFRSLGAEVANYPGLIAEITRWLFAPNPLLNDHVV